MKLSRWVPAVLATCAIGGGVVVFDRVAGAQDIVLKSRTVATSVRTTEPQRVQGGRTPQQATALAAAPDAPLHQIVQFDHPPGVEDLNALMQAGFRVVAAVPDDAVMVVSARPETVTVPGVRWTGTLEQFDKLSPELSRPDVAADQPQLAIVEFHADVEAAQQDAVAAAEGVALQRPAGLLASHAVVTASFDVLAALAAHDEVAYIFPADPALLGAGSPLLPCAGMITLSGAVAQYSNVLRGWPLDTDNAAHLGYVFGQITPKVQTTAAESEILRALDEWTKYANVTYAPVAAGTTARTVYINFFSGSHGDPYPFTSQGAVLAHTFYPVPVNGEPMAGDMHLNADENWHTGDDIDIYSVALHEAGHAIGLTHSDKVGDVMYPYYRRGMSLSANDIGAARQLYGAAVAGGGGASAPITTAPAPSPTPAPTPTPAPAAVHLALDPVAQPGQNAQISMTGTVSGGTPPFTVQWQSDHGYTGKAAVSATGAWQASAVTLVTGSNTITVTAVDAAQQSAAQTAVVTRLQSTPVSGATPVSIRIASPAGSVVTTSASSISLSGKAAGGAGVTEVNWQTAAGASGTATGAGDWVISSVPISQGTNTILVRAVDAKGASAWASVTVVRH